ncbi:AAA family ATPase [Candidatus Woesearchaeota archaeon]|nr:AAA family ATPase [Candidatus Woesearchaeota archaeon]
MKVIAVTGVPGTGKTTIAKKLAKRLNYYYVDVNKIIKKYKLSEGFDRKRRTKVVDIKRLNKVLIDYVDFFKNIIGRENIGMRPMSSATITKTLTKQYIKKTINKKFIKKIQNQKIKGIAIDSHLSHYLPKKYVDLVIVAKCDIKELNKRLKKRKYLKNKIQENIQAEIFDVCYDEASERKHNILKIDTSKGFNINRLAIQIGG